MCAHGYPRTCTHTWAGICTCMCIHVHVYTQGCAHTSVYTGMCTCMHTCLPIHVYTCAHIHICMHMYTDMHTHARVPTCTCMHVYTQAHKRTRTHSCALTHANQEGSHSDTAVLPPGAGVWLRLVFSASFPHPPHPRAMVPTYLGQSGLSQEKGVTFSFQSTWSLCGLDPTGHRVSWERAERRPAGPLPAALSLASVTAPRPVASLAGGPPSL